MPLTLSPRLRTSYLRSNVDEALVTALKVYMINDRETFVGLDDTEAEFKNIAPDQGIDLVNAHEREMSRLISAWKHVLPQRPNATSTQWLRPTVCPRRSFQRIGRP